MLDKFIPLINVTDMFVVYVSHTGVVVFNFYVELSGAQ